MERPKIKRCPFCGGKAKLQDGMIVLAYHIICLDRKCGADVWFYNSEFEANETIRKWNRRDYHGEETENAGN